LDKNVYKALEGIVGPEHISDDPAILDSYAWTTRVQNMEIRDGEVRLNKFARRFEAVLLPADTLEVQAIVKLCNRKQIKIRTFSTGFIAGNVPSGERVILLDLRRMNRIIEIDEQNMLAVVEPYVIGAQLQAELMKRGLIANVTGAGSHTSALPLAAFWGTGHMGQTVSNGERNLLAVEWVTPEGETVRIGSLGAIGEYFCGDGPGFSLRGVLRGAITPMGGMGIYTKAATKVYHWPGPTEFPIEGTSPNYAPSAIPENFMIRYFSFSTKERLQEAICKIGEAEIAFELMGFPVSMMAANIATGNEEEVRLLADLRKAVKGPGFVVIIVGNSRREFEYKKKVLERIVDETEGRSLEMIEDERVGGALLWRLIRITASIRETFRATGEHTGIFPGHSELGPIYRLTSRIADLKQDLIAKGLLLDDGAEPFPWTEEHGSMAHAEVLIRYRSSPQTLQGIQWLNEESIRLCLEEPAGVPFFVRGDRLHGIFGPSASNYHVWLRRLKKAFDPNGVCDPLDYISPEEGQNS